MAKSILMNWQPTTLPHSLKPVGEEFTIVTGGALGADSSAEECAKEWGMNVELKLCPHHHRVSDAQPSLSRAQLARVAYQVDRAGNRLGRQPTKNPFVRDLLARNWYIVNDVCVICAYRRFEDDSLTTVEGGTGWTVQMCVDHNREYPDLWKPLFVYDEGRMEWYELEVTDEDEYDVHHTKALGNLRFNACFSGPILHPRSAVVGHRVLGEHARHAMKDQFERKRWQHVEVREHEKKVEELTKKFEAMNLNENV